MSAPFDKLRPPRPPIELRARVLDAAFAASAESRHWIDGVWESRRFRFALAVAFGLAFAAQLLTPEVPLTLHAEQEVVEIDGIALRVDRFESNASLSMEIVQ